MSEKLKKLESSTSSLQNILVSLGLIIGALWALYTFFTQENKNNKFSPDVYIEHEILINKKLNEIYLEVYLIVKNTSVQNLTFKLVKATAESINNDNKIKLHAEATNSEIVIHPGQVMKLPYIFPITNSGIYLISVNLPLGDKHVNYLKGIGKTSKEIQTYTFNAKKYVYAGN